jgi:hypothetical protein
MVNVRHLTNSISRDPVLRSGYKRTCLDALHFLFLPLAIESNTSMLCKKKGLRKPPSPLTKDFKEEVNTYSLANQLSCQHSRQPKVEILLLL